MVPFNLSRERDEIDRQVNFLTVAGKKRGRG